MPAKSLLSELEIYDLDELAAVAGVSVATLRQCVRAGRLRATRLGRKWKVTRENAMAFLNGANDDNPRSLIPRSTRQAETATMVAPRALAMSYEPSSAPAAGQLLFLKPDDLDRLVAGLAIHVERIERLSERRENELRSLVESLAQENADLRGDLTALRSELAAAIHFATEQIMAEVSSADRVETERLRFRWLQDQLIALGRGAEARIERKRGRWPWSRSS